MEREVQSVFSYPRILLSVILYVNSRATLTVFVIMHCILVLFLNCSGLVVCNCQAIGYKDPRMMKPLVRLGDYLQKRSGCFILFSS